MTSNDNSVNIKPTGDYHHGDLRSAALSLGLTKLALQEVPDIGLRELARELGVSATALYRHFPNKDALLDALASAALKKLGARQAEAARRAGGARAAFHEVGFTYVQWAHENPSLFRLVFARIGRVDVLMDGSVDLGEAFQQLTTGIDNVLGEGAHQEEKQVAQLRAWSIVHGLANLVVDGQIAWDEQLVREMLGASSMTGS